jgi:hypothetical protein
MYVPVDVGVGRWYYNVTGRCVVGWYVDGTNVMSVLVEWYYVG